MLRFYHCLRYTLTLKQEKFNRVKSCFKKLIRSRFWDGTVKQSVWIPGGLSAPSWQTLSHLRERCLKRWELLTTSVCVRVCVCVFVPACASRHHIWQTWRNNNAVLSAGLVPGRRLEAGVVWFSQTSREPAITPHIDLHTHAHLIKHNTCMPAHTYTHIVTYPPGPWFWICAFTSDGNINNRAVSVNKTKKKTHPNVKSPCVSIS